jgi:hypothetical protein
LPIFYTGVPNLAPYQLATGKTAGNPLSAGKPFINNFLPTFGDMLRLNMAVPVTQRNDPKFSSEGIIAAAVLGLTDPMYNGSTALQFIPNMDGFPNGRRLEDDVTRIELQAVSGAALAAVGLFYDDYTIGSNPVTPKLLNVLGYTTGVESNDDGFQASFPYVALPKSGFGNCGGSQTTTGIKEFGMGIGAPAAMLSQNYPNPFNASTTFKYRISSPADIKITIVDLSGKVVANLVNARKAEGLYEVQLNAANLSTGIYLAYISADNKLLQSFKITCVKE